jgi:hypothetical protein
VEPAVPHPGPSDLQREANRRWLRRLALTAVVIAVLVPLTSHGLLFREHRPAHHHANPLKAVLALAIVLLAWTAMFLLMRRSYKRGGIYSPPAIVGLPWRERRAALRAIRAGDLSDDPRIREAQISLASRTVKQARLNPIAAAACLAGAGWFTFLSPQTTALGRAYFAVLAILGIWGFRKYPKLLRGSRQILAQAGQTPPQTP